MRERPISFSPAMVRALLEGRKTQTRRIVKSTLYLWEGQSEDDCEHFYQHDPRFGDALMRLGRCPYGQPGDRLWVRETARVIDVGRANGGRVVRLWYEADGVESDWLPYPSRLAPPAAGRCVPNGVHREGARTMLEVVSIRVERAQDITEEDAIREGARRFDNLPSIHPYGLDDRWSMEEPTSTEQCLGTARLAFANYVSKLHGGPRWMFDSASSLWSLNPWFWVITFRRLA